MEMTYRQNGDYLIPDIRLSEQEETPIGKYGQMRKQYLKEHRPILWNRLVLSEQLYPHLREIDGTAHRRLDELMPQMAKQAGVTEELKRRDPSQGTHFFQNLTSFGVGYFTIDTNTDNGIYRKEVLDAMPAVEETQFVRHVRFDKPLKILMDGKKQEGVVLI